MHKAVATAWHPAAVAFLITLRSLPLIPSQVGYTQDDIDIIHSYSNGNVNFSQFDGHL